MTKTAPTHETQTELLQKLAAIGHRMDATRGNHALMCSLLRERRVVVAQLEAGRSLEPYRFTGMTADGYACYDEV